MGLEWGIKRRGILEEEKVGSHPRCLPHLKYSTPAGRNITSAPPCQYMVVGRAEGEVGRGRGKRGPSKRGKKKGVGGEGRGGGPPGSGAGLLLAGEQGVDDGGQQQVISLSQTLILKVLSSNHPKPHVKFILQVHMNVANQTTSLKI